MRTALRFLPLILLMSALPLRAQREKLPWDDRIYVEKTWPKAIKTSIGLRYIILKPGQGTAMPKAGDMVSVLFQGRLLHGRVFSQALDPAHPFQIRLGNGQLIEGWEDTLKYMKRGEKRLVIVPGELGYGTRGNPEQEIPRNATLVFEIELLDFTRG